jgi:hypothetical protein
MLDGNVVCITRSCTVNGKQMHSKQFITHAVMQNIRAKNAKNARTIITDKTVFEKTFLKRTKNADDG